MVETKTVSRAEVLRFAHLAIKDSESPELRIVPAHWGPKWQLAHAKFIKFLETGRPQWTIFVKENSKLKFFQFSTLPDITCPGAGECLKWCYSFKAWRHADAFFRQLQDTILVLNQSDYLRDAFLNLPENEIVRLYVDGDIDSIDTLKFWCDLMSKRLDLQVYGYSKSWAVFLEYNQSGQEWPTNYILNLSGGSLYRASIRAQMEQLPIVRGEFVAVKAPARMPSRRDTPALWAEWARVVKESARKLGYSKAFVCPGKCYDCLPKQEHACGSWKFKNIPIVIGIH